MVDRYEYHPRLGRMLHEEGYPPLFSVPTWMVKENDYMTILRKYGRHIERPNLCPAANFYADERGPCTCGLEEALGSPASGGTDGG